MTTYDPSSPNLPESTRSVKTDPAARPERPPTHHCATAKRHSQRRAHFQRGMLDPKSPTVAARLRDEGVPPTEVRAVAMDLWRILPLMRTGGVEAACIRVHPWVGTLIERYADKIASLMMVTR
jgi:hypothetical protein